MQSPPPRKHPEAEVHQPHLRATFHVALAMVLVCTLVVLIHHMGQDLRAANAVGRAAPGTITLRHVGRLKKEGQGLRTEIQALAERLTSVPHSLQTTRPGVLLVRARHSARASLELIEKMELAVRRSRNFLASHLRNEARMEHRAARSYLDLAKQVLAGG